jgi:hypothetical protein
MTAEKYGAISAALFAPVLRLHSRCAMLTESGGLHPVGRQLLPVRSFLVPGIESKVPDFKP